MKYDEETIKNKYDEIIKDAEKLMNGEGKLPSFALTPKEMEIINEAEKLGYKLHIIHKGEKVRIPIVKMRF